MQSKKGAICIEYIQSAVRTVHTHSLLFFIVLFKVLSNDVLHERARLTVHKRPTVPTNLRMLRPTCNYYITTHDIYEK